MTKEKVRVICANCGFVFDTNRSDNATCSKCGSNAIDKHRQSKVNWFRSKF